MVKIYSVWKNTGNWGGYSSQLVVAENEIEAMLGTFSCTGDKPKERMQDWIDRGYDLSAREATQEVLNQVIDIKNTCSDKYNIEVSIKLVPNTLNVLNKTEVEIAKVEIAKSEPEKEE